MTRGVAARALRAVVRLLAATWHLDVVGEQQVLDLRRSSIPIVFAVWHAHLLAPFWHRRREGVTLLVSDHADAWYLTVAARAWGYRVIHGSTTRGGVAGLKGVVRTLVSGGDAAFAADGPRGPARVAKPGVLHAAARAGAAIVPVGAAASATWRLRSWDRFTIPAPFAHVRIVYGAPWSPAAAGAQDVAELRRQLDEAQCRAAC